MKVRKKLVRRNEHLSDGSTSNVLDLEYTHKGKAWRILVKEYKERQFPLILKQLRNQVKELYKTSV